MSNQDRRKPGDTPNQRKPKRSKKAPQQPGIRPEFESEPTQAAIEPIDNSVTSVEAAVSEAVSEAAYLPATTAPIETEAAASEVAVNEGVAKDLVANPLPGAFVPSAQSAPVGLQAIASAYRDYTQKSFAEATSFVEKLAAARSLDK